MKKLILVFLLLLPLTSPAMESMTFWEYQQFQATLKKMDGCFDAALDQNGVTHISLRFRYKIETIIYHEKVDGYDYTALIGRVFTLADLLPATNLVEAYDKGCWQ